MDRRAETPEQGGTGVPRDLPDQQAGEPRTTPDPWEGTGRAGGDKDDDAEEQADADLPDPDVSGTGRRGAVHSGGTRPDHPTPDEPAD
ncbi:hypothetical protein [Streptomyces sp. NPDC003077]|uniref:hypothetical protein n=1 Tax=Streptomyces sp. NPDC003077 TaxID=3154443 RepID=UPI0033B81C91